MVNTSLSQILNKYVVLCKQSVLLYIVNVLYQYTVSCYCGFRSSQISTPETISKFLTTVASAATSHLAMAEAKAENHNSFSFLSLHSVATWQKSPPLFSAASSHHFLPYNFHFHHILLLISFFSIPLPTLTDETPH